MCSDLCRLSLVCWLICCSWFSAAQAADFVIVAHPSNQNPVDQQQLLQWYLHKNSAFADGSPVQLLHLERSSPEHQSFCLELMNLTASQYQSYWARLLFTGNAKALDFSDPVDILQQVRQAPAAIAYLPANTPLKGVLRLGYLRNGQWQADRQEF